jgi:hypothetical protein
VKQKPNAALTEMLRRDGALDRLLDGRGLEFTPAEVIGNPGPPPQPFQPEPPDWDAERREREAREREQELEKARALLSEDGQP